ncbi:MAG: hypothetical protein LQ352_008422, partial [Teloschistes flavicans]
MWHCFALLLSLLLRIALSITPPSGILSIEQAISPPGLPEASLYNASLQNGNNDTIHHLSDGSLVVCFHPSHPTSLPLRLIRYIDCYMDMARGLLIGDEVMIRKRWARPNIPYSYNAGTCMIVVSSEEHPSAVGYFQMAE